MSTYFLQMEKQQPPYRKIKEKINLQNALFSKFKVFIDAYIP